MDTILIIEDNALVSKNTTELLKLAGYTVFTATNGKEGLESAKINKPDLILCDIMMPTLDGYGVLRALENIPELSGVPFIFMTAKTDKEHFRKAMDLGADDYLPKPFSGDDLLRIVSARLKKSRLAKKTFETNLDGLNDFIHTNKSLQDVKILSDNRAIKKLRKKDILFMEGELSNFVYLVVSGKIKKYKSNEWGKEYITDIYKPGDFFGYSTLLNGESFKKSAMAIENSEVALVPKEDFFQLLHSSNEVCLKFTKLLSNNLLEKEEKLLKLAYNSARKRVAEAILFIASKYKEEEEKNGLAFTLHREDISALAGISPESVSRNLTYFREEGLIEINNANIQIINIKKLENLKN